MTQVDRYVRSRHFKFITYAVNIGQFRALWPFICSILVTHPLAEIEIWVENTTPHFLDMYGLGIPVRAIFATFGLLKNVHFKTIPAAAIRPVTGNVFLKYMLREKMFSTSIQQYLLWIPLSSTSSNLVIGNELLNSMVYNLRAQSSPMTTMLVVDHTRARKSNESWYFFMKSIPHRPEILAQGQPLIRECGDKFNNCSSSDILQIDNTEKDKYNTLSTKKNRSIDDTPCVSTLWKSLQACCLRCLF